MMTSSRFALVLSVALFPCTLAGAAQTAVPPATATGILSPALGQLRQTLAGIRLDKWKAPGPVREQASGNMGSITRDLEATLPGLLANADAMPGSVSKNLLVFRNVDALYDVLLRIVETADLAAPESETDRLHAALASLEDARRSLGDSMESAAVSQEQRLASLDAQVQSLSARTAGGSDSADETTKPAAGRKHKPTAKKASPVEPQ